MTVVVGGVVVVGAGDAVLDVVDGAVVEVGRVVLVGAAVVVLDGDAADVDPPSPVHAARAQSTSATVTLGR
jgi:hypothetical protein